MAKVRARPETGNLYLDFFYRGKRCREQTALVDNPANRRMVEALAARIKREMAKGTFDYGTFFPDSPRAAQFAGAETSLSGSAGSTPSHPAPATARVTTTLGEFTETWYSENLPRWRNTHAETIRGTLDQHILPHFKLRPLAEINRAELLAFRAELGCWRASRTDLLARIQN